MQWVTEAEERRYRMQVQTLFFGATDRLRARVGTADRLDVMAVLASGFGQAVQVYAPGEAEAWRQAFFDFLRELGAKVTTSTLAPAAPRRHAAELARALRDDEEWFFPGGALETLKAWLVANARAVPLMKPEVSPREAAGVFVTHFDAAVREPLPPGKDRPAKGRGTAGQALRGRRLARPVARKAKR